MRMRRLLRRQHHEEAPTVDDVYRLFGMATESAQLLEQTIRGRARAVEWASVADDLSGDGFSRINDLERKTMGWVQNEKRYTVPDDIRDLVTA